MAKKDVKVFYSRTDEERERMKERLGTEQRFWKSRFTARRGKEPVEAKTYTRGADGVFRDKKGVPMEGGMREEGLSGSATRMRMV